MADTSQTTTTTSTTTTSTQTVEFSRQIQNFTNQLNSVTKTIKDISGKPLQNFVKQLDQITQTIPEITGSLSTINKQLKKLETIPELKIDYEKLTSRFQKKLNTVIKDINFGDLKTFTTDLSGKVGDFFGKIGTELTSITGALTNVSDFTKSLQGLQTIDVTAITETLGEIKRQLGSLEIKPIDLTSSITPVLESFSPLVKQFQELTKNIPSFNDLNANLKVVEDHLKTLSEVSFDFHSIGDKITKEVSSSQNQLLSSLKNNLEDLLGSFKANLTDLLNKQPESADLKPILTQLTDLFKTPSGDLKAHDLLVNIQGSLDELKGKFDTRIFDQIVNAVDLNKTTLSQKLDILKDSNTANLTTLAETLNQKSETLNKDLQTGIKNAQETFSKELITVVQTLSLLKDGLEKVGKVDLKVPELTMPKDLMLSLNQIKTSLSSLEALKTLPSEIEKALSNLKVGESLKIGDVEKALSNLKIEAPIKPSISVKAPADSNIRGLVDSLNIMNQKFDQLVGDLPKAIASVNRNIDVNLGPSPSLDFSEIGSEKSKESSKSLEQIKKILTSSQLTANTDYKEALQGILKIFDDGTKEQKEFLAKLLPNLENPNALTADTFKRFEESLIKKFGQTNPKILASLLKYFKDFKTYGVTYKQNSKKAFEQVKTNFGVEKKSWDDFSDRREKLEDILSGIRNLNEDTLDSLNIKKDSTEKQFAYLYKAILPIKEVGKVKENLSDLINLTAYNSDIFSNVHSVLETLDNDVEKIPDAISLSDPAKQKLFNQSIENFEKVIDRIPINLLDPLEELLTQKAKTTASPVVKEKLERLKKYKASPMGDERRELQETIQTNLDNIFKQLPDYGKAIREGLIPVVQSGEEFKTLVPQLIGALNTQIQKGEINFDKLFEEVGPQIAETVGYGGQEAFKEELKAGLLANLQKDFVGISKTIKDYEAGLTTVKKSQYDYAKNLLQTFKGTKGVGVEPSAIDPSFIQDPLRELNQVLNDFKTELPERIGKIRSLTPNLGTKLQDVIGTLQENNSLIQDESPAQKAAAILKSTLADFAKELQEPIKKLNDIQKLKSSLFTLNQSIGGIESGQKKAQKADQEKPNQTVSEVPRLGGEELKTTPVVDNALKKVESAGAKAESSSASPSIPSASSMPVIKKEDIVATKAEMSVKEAQKTHDTIIMQAAQDGVKATASSSAQVQESIEQFSQTNQQDFGDLTEVMKQVAGKLDAIINILNNSNRPNATLRQV